MGETETHPLLPTPTADSAPYWDGLNAGELRLQKCRACGTVRHYPRPVCDQCFSMDVDWIAASRRGTVLSWTTTHHAFHPAFKASLPQTFVTVDLDEGVRLCAPLRGADAAALLSGLPVEIGFERIAPEWAIPVVTVA